MGQAGLTSYEEAGRDPCYGIPDFSAKEDAEKFTVALGQWLAVVETELQKGRAATGVFDYPKCSKEVEKLNHTLTGVHLEKQKA